MKIGLSNPGFLVDFDGLLINSEELSRVAFERMCNELSCAFSDDFHASIRGKQIRDWSSEFVEKFGLEMSAATVADRHTQLLLEELDKSAELMPGARDLLIWISKRGYPSALVTSSRRDYVITYLKKLSISQYFKSMITAEDASTGKPSPVPYLLGARAIGLDPSSCVVIEDSVNGVLAGKAAGSIVIAVPSTGADLAAMKSADHVVSSLEGALEILTKMGL